MLMIQDIELLFWELAVISRPDVQIVLSIIEVEPEDSVHNMHM